MSSIGDVIIAHFCSPQVTFVQGEDLQLCLHFPLAVRVSRYVAQMFTKVESITNHRPAFQYLKADLLSIQVILHLNDLLPSLLSAIP